MPTLMIKLTGFFPLLMEVNVFIHGGVGHWAHMLPNITVTLLLYPPLQDPVQLRENVVSVLQYLHQLRSGNADSIAGVRLGLRQGCVQDINIVLQC